MKSNDDQLHYRIDVLVYLELMLKHLAPMNRWSDDYTFAVIFVLVVFCHCYGADLAIFVMGYNYILEYFGFTVMHNLEFERLCYCLHI